MFRQYKQVQDSFKKAGVVFLLPAVCLKSDGFKKRKCVKQCTHVLNGRRNARDCSPLPGFCKFADKFIPSAQEAPHIIGEQHFIKHFTKDTAGRFEFKAVFHTCKVSFGNKIMIVPHASERALQLLIPEMIGPLEGADMTCQILAPPQVFGSPGNKFTGLDESTCSSGNSLLFCSGSRQFMEVYAGAEIKADLRSGMDPGFEENEGHIVLFQDIIGASSSC
jgi:hypothetical protein